MPWMREDEQRLHERLLHDVESRAKLALEAAAQESRLGRSGILLITVAGVIAILLIHDTGDAKAPFIAGLAGLGLIAVAALLYVRRFIMRWLAAEAAAYEAGLDAEYERHEGALGQF